MSIPPTVPPITCRRHANQESDDACIECQAELCLATGYEIQPSGNARLDFRDGSALFLIRDNNGNWTYPEDEP